MPTLNRERETKKVTLEDDDNGELEIYTDVLIGDVIGLVDNDISEGDKMIQLLPKLIKSWNYTEEDGSPTPITGENIQRLTAKSLSKLTEFLNFQEDAKKN